MLDKRNFNMEVCFTSTDDVKRWVTFFGANPYSYSLDNIVKHPLMSRIPCGIIVENMWLNLQFDIKSFSDRCFESN